MYRKLLIIVLVVLSPLVYCKKPGSGGEKAAKSVEYETISPRLVKRTIHLVGVVKANRESHISAQIDGNIDIIEEYENSFVKKDQVIAKFSNDNLQEQMTLAKSAEAIAKANYDRMQKLRQKDTVSQAFLEETKGKWLQTQLIVNDKKQALDQTIIKAPFDGMLGPFLATEGAMVKKGDELVVIHDMSSFVIEVEVPSKSLTKIKKGQKFKIRDQIATVSEVQQTIDPITHMGIVRAKMAKCPECILGQAVDVKLILDKKKNVLAVPNSAVFCKNNKSYIFVIDKDKAKLTLVDVRLIGDNYTEIKAKIKTGDLVITNNPSRLKDGENVKTL